MLLSALVASFAFSSATSGLAVRQASDYLQNAVTTAETLQKLFYDDLTGLWTGSGPKSNEPTEFWWSSANCLSTLTLLLGIDNSTSSLISPIVENTFVQAQTLNFGQSKTSISTWPATAHYHEALIWAMTWVHTYDVTGDPKYLELTAEIFQYVAFNGANATCGGIWWDVEHKEEHAITQLTFLAVSTHLATRAENGDYYLDWSLRQWRWLERSGLIQPSGLVVEILDPNTCVAVASSPTFSGPQGVLIGGLLELNKSDPNVAYINLAKKVGDASIKALTDSNGILTEYGSNGSPALSAYEASLKGLFIRHVVLLAQALDDSTYIAYLQKQADTIWISDRSLKNDTIGNVWDHYFGQLTSPGHCAGFDALVAAATIS